MASVTHPTFTRAQCPTCGHKRAVFNGAHFRQVRERAGVTLREMARRLDVCAAYVSDMELGKRRFLVKYVLPYRRLR